MSGPIERKKGIQIHRSIVYGSHARLLTPEEAKLATPGHTHRWTVFLQSAATPPPRVHDRVEGGALGSGSGKGKGKDKDGQRGSGSGSMEDDNNDVIDEDDDFITGGADDLGWLIKRVTFKLHETYPSPNRQIDKPPYRVTETGWGEFPLTIRVQFAQETGEKGVGFQHQLRLHHWGPVVAGGGGRVSNEAGGGGSGGGEAGPMGHEAGQRTGDATTGGQTELASPNVPSPMTDDQKEKSLSSLVSTNKEKEGTDVDMSSTDVGEEKRNDVSTGINSTSQTGLGGSVDVSGSRSGSAEVGVVHGEGETNARGTTESTRMEVDELTGDVEMKDGEVVDGGAGADTTTTVKPEPGEKGVTADDSSQMITVSAPMKLNAAATTTTTATTDPTSASSTSSEFPQINPLPVHSWQYDQFVFTDPTTTFYQLLLAHPETPLPKRSLRRGQDIGQGAILGLDRGSAGVPLEFTKELELAERVRLEDVRKTLVQETDRWRQRLIDLEREAQQLKDEIASA